MNKITKLLGQYMAVIETSMELADECLKDATRKPVDQIQTTEFFLEDATEALTRFETTMTNNLQHLSEWQTSVFHDLYGAARQELTSLYQRVLDLRNNLDLNQPLTTTKES